MAVIEANKVCKLFKRTDGQPGKFFALKDITLAIEQGEIFGILGPNGAGKTTFLSILTGLLSPDGGDVKLFGQKVTPGNVAKYIGYVSHEERFHWSLTAYDILNFGGILQSMDSRQRKERIEELVQLFRIRKLLGRKFEMLSTGEKMRLTFAYALIKKPRLLLLDEPTLGLDPDISIKIRKEVKRINKQMGTTIVLTTHYMHEVEELCDRIAFIKEGHIKQVGKVSDIRKKFPNLEAYFVKMAERDKGEQDD
jgi:ABC-2 type transport system ATP-binding protein